MFDDGGKFNPQFEPETLNDIEADTVMFAIGQTSDLSFLQPGDGVESVRGLIKVNPETYQTTAPDVFACGDIAHGPRLFIDAIASAQIAARSMHDWLQGTRTDVVVRKRWLPAAYAMAPGWEVRERDEPPVIEVARRAASNDIVEEAFPEAEARLQASRCLRCNVNTVFDTSMCVACNGCVDVCPQGILRLVPLSTLAADPGWRQQASAFFGMTQAAFEALPHGRARRDGLGDDQGRDHVHPLRDVRVALPDARGHDAAVRVLPRVRDDPGRGSAPQVRPGRRMTPWELAAAFGLGFVGSVHCAQMCGPIVLAYSLPMGGQPLRGQAIAHAAYNGGRLTTYAVLGAAAGAAGGAIDVVGRFAGFAHAAALAGGVLLVLFGLVQAGAVAGATRAGARCVAPASARRLSGLSARWLQAPGAGRKLSLGLVLGLLPCGLVYAALLQAMTTGSLAGGAASMGAFGLGTAPALVGVGFASGPLGRRLAGRGPRLAAVAVTLLGVLLLWRGVMVPIPTPGGHPCH